MARVKWIVGSGPGQGLLSAVIIFVVAYWLGHIGLGLSIVLAGIMVGYSFILVVFSRSGAIETLSQPNRDERTFNIHLKASAVSLTVVAFLTVGAFLVDLAHGNTSVTPWVTVAAVSGLSYLVAAVFFSIRN